MKREVNLHLVLPNYVYVTLAISLATLAASFIAQRFLPPQIPLFFGQPEGEAQLAPSLALALPSALSLLFLILNCGFSLILRDDFLKKALVVTSLVVSVFAAIATLKILFLVGSF